RPASKALFLPGKAGQTDAPLDHPPGHRPRAVHERRILMTELSRREALAATAVAGLALGAPALAQNAAGDGAAWDLTELYPSDAAWDAARKEALEAIKGLAPYQGRLGES